MSTPTSYSSSSSSSKEGQSSKTKKKRSQRTARVGAETAEEEALASGEIIDTTVVAEIASAKKKIGVLTKELENCNKNFEMMLLKT